MDITQMDLKDLKVLHFDMVQQYTQLGQNIQAVLQEIQKKTPKFSGKVEEKPTVVKGSGGVGVTGQKSGGGNNK